MWCGCFHCLQVYEAIEVIDWVDDGETPLCPRCGVDAVMIGVTDLVELLNMHRIRFGRRPDLSRFDPNRLVLKQLDPNRLDQEPGSASDTASEN